MDSSDPEEGEEEIEFSNAGPLSLIDSRRGGRGKRRAVVYDESRLRETSGDKRRKYLVYAMLAIVVLAAGYGLYRLNTSSSSSSSSSSEIDCWSKDVLGDSGCNSCAGSNRDCRDTEDVSVLLSCGCWGCVCCVTGGEGLALPVMSRFLNISTFILGGPPASLSFPRSSVVARCSPSCASLVANVLANGL